MAEEFTITIPGWDDVIKIKPMHTLSKEKQRELTVRRIISMKESPTPEIVRSISSLAVYLDDAEDILSTAMILGRPLLRRLPSRMIPGLGWVLLVTDILDFGTWIISSATGGPTGKRKAIDQIRNVSLSRGNRMRKIDKFHRLKPGLPQLIEGLQATETIFGVGLSIGPLMGLFQDTVWSLMRLGEGARIKIRMTTPPNIAQLAAKFLLQSNLLMGLGPLLGIDDTLKLWAANEYANLWLQEEKESEEMISRANIGLGLRLPQFIPGNPLTREILALYDVDPDRDEGPPPPFDFGEKPFIADAVDAALQVFPKMRDAYKHLYQDKREAEFSAMGAIQSSEMTMSWVEAEDVTARYSPNLGDTVPVGMVELGKGLRSDADPIVVAAFLHRIAVLIYLDAGLNPSNWGRVDNPLTEDWGLDPMPVPTLFHLQDSARIFGLELIDI